MDPKVGVGSFIGVGEQTGYTTSASRTKFVPMISGGDSIKRDDAIIKTGSLESIGYHSSRYIQGKRDVNGNETIEVSYEGTELFWKHLFGQVSTSQPNPSGQPTVYDHLFTFADTLPVGLTLEINRGGYSFLVEGAKISSGEISVNMDEFLQLNMTFMGRNMDTTTASVASFTTTKGFAAPNAVLQWNGVEQDVSGWKINVNHNLDGDRFFIGSRLRKAPVRGGRLEFTGSFDTEFQDLTLFNDFKNATTRQIVISAVGDQIGSTGYYYSWTMTIPIALLNDATPTVNDGGRITFSPSFEAFRTSSAGEAQLFIRNTVSSV